MSIVSRLGTIWSAHFHPEPKGPTHWLAFALVVSTSLLSHTANAHPLKLSASIIKYDSARRSLRMECKVFIDDFQLSLVNSILKDRDPNSVKREDRRELIEQYFQMFYSVRHNGRSLTWRVEQVIPLYRENVLVIQFDSGMTRLKKGDKVTVENTIMFRDFGSAQTNRTVMVIPEYDIDDGHAATVRDYTMTYTLGRSKP